ncbi:MAG: GHKL domain-containing protein [Lachnospiraceae bacterium]|nr:GHKL domain-containing protein [Lachnospiraceae bacterium]
MFTSDTLLAAFSYLLEVTPFHLLAYYPFRGDLRRPRWTAFFVSFKMSAGFIICCYLYTVGKDLRTADIFFALTSILIYFPSIDTEIPKLIFIYVLIIDYIMIVRGISIFIHIRFFHTPDTPLLLLSAPAGIMVHMIPSILLAPFMLYFLKITRERVLKIHAPALWSTMWLLPVLTTGIVLLFTYDLDQASISGLSFLLARVCLLIISVVIYFIFISSLETLRLQGEAEERARNQAQLIALQQQQYTRLQKQIEETRLARHDLRQHLNLIQTYLDIGDDATLRDYIRKYGQKLPLNAEKTYCQNYAVDAVVRYYAAKAEEAQIRFDAHIHLPEHLAVDEPDICILFGNLLENALEPCLQLPEGTPFIRIHAQIAGQRAISITVDNTSQEHPVRKKGQLLSTKHPGTGVGTLSICSIAERYHGVTEFQWQDGVFYASVFLNP